MLFRSPSGDAICGGEDPDFPGTVQEADPNYPVEHAGVDSGSCSSSYVVFNHDYNCSFSGLDALQTEGRECETGPSGRLLNSPCFIGSQCVFQPRVHVKDNWGWCTGFCDSGSDGKDGCFEGEGSSNDECRIDVCPSEDTSNNCPDKDGGTTNPWVNYSGLIRLNPSN